MIKIELSESRSLAIIRPERMHGLAAADFEQLTARINGYLTSHAALNGLVIVAGSFPGWQDMQAFVSHFKFVRDHHKAIRKVAIVSDSPLLSATPYLTDHFVRANVRHFASQDIEDAKTWVALQDKRSGRFVVLDRYPEDVLALRAEGTITREDYEETLIPLAEERIKAKGKIKLLYWCGEKFEGFSACAVWDDAWFGVKHLGDFSRIAVVTDANWLRQSVKLFAPLIPAPVQLFHNADIESATDWIAEG